MKIGVPRRLMEDDVYKGMHIPKGSIVSWTCQIILVTYEP